MVARMLTGASTADIEVHLSKQMGLNMTLWTTMRRATGNLTELFGSDSREEGVILYNHTFQHESLVTNLKASTEAMCLKPDFLSSQIDGATQHRWQSCNSCSGKEDELKTDVSSPLVNKTSKKLTTATFLGSKKHTKELLSGNQETVELFMMKKGNKIVTQERLIPSPFKRRLNVLLSVHS